MDQEHSENDKPQEQTVHQLNYAQKQESQWKERIIRIDQAMERHWRAPWIVIAILLLGFVTTQVIVNEKYRREKQAERNEHLDEEYRLIVAQRRVMSAVKGLPENRNTIRELENILSPEKPFVRAKTRENYTKSDVWEWSNPEIGTVWILDINNRGENPDSHYYSVTNPVQVGGIGNGRTALQEAHEKLWKFREGLVPFIFALYAIFALLWIGMFMLRSRRGRLIGTAHLLFLSLTATILMSLRPNYFELPLPPRLWLCFGLAGLSGLGCGIFFPRKGFLRILRVGVILLSAGFMLLSAGWFWQKKVVPGVFHYQMEGYLVDTEQVDTVVPSAGRQMAIGGKLQRETEYFPKLSISAPAQTAELDEGTFSALVSGDKSSVFKFNGGSYSWFPFYWWPSVEMGDSQLSGINHRIPGEDFFFSHCAVNSTSRRLHVEQRLIYCLNGNLTANVASAWEGKIPPPGRVRVVFYPLDLGDGVKKYLVVSHQVTIDGK